MTSPEKQSSFKRNTREMGVLTDGEKRLVEKVGQRQIGALWMQKKFREIEGTNDLSKKNYFKHSK